MLHATIYYVFVTEFKGEDRLSLKIVTHIKGIAIAHIHYQAILEMTQRAAVYAKST